MGCTHPEVLIERIVRSDGTKGIRCRGCNMFAFAGESKRRGLWKGTLAFLGLYPDLPPGTKKVVDS